MLRVILAFALLASPAMAERLQTSAGPVEVKPMVSGLDTPWAVAFLPDGGLLITERDGVLWRTDATGQRQAVQGLPEVRARGQGGLLDVVLDPGFAENNTIYLSYSEPVGIRSAGTAVARARLDDLFLRDLQVIFRQAPDQTGGRHFGSRIVPDGNGHLYVTLGDRGEADLAQDLSTHMGKVVRIGTDGSVPADNPFVGSERPEIWSYGHRNPQGAALDETGQIWTVAHGARGGDEINRPLPGRNYGWPVISYGTTYAGFQIGEGTHKDGMEQPMWYWDPSIAPSGMAIYSGKLWPDWAGDIFVGSLKFDLISRLDRNGDSISGEEQLFQGRFGRIRDVREGPNGALWFLAEADGTLYRVTPAE